MELKELNRVIKEKKATVSQADLSVQEFQHDIQVLTKDKTSAANKVAGLEATHEWIAQDKEWVCYPSFHILGADPFYRQFGNPGTQYDWGGKSITELDHKVKELEENQRGMKRKINPKVMNMIDKWVVILFPLYMVF